MLTLYLAPGSSSMAPHIALHEIGAPFERRVVSFAKKEQRAPGYLALNPEGKVPLLVAGEQRITEVLAILYYLAKRFPEARLLGAATLEAEVQAVSWMSFLASTVHMARRQGPEQARAVFELANRRLGDGEWAIGEYSIADIHLFRLFWRFRNFLQLDPAEFPNLARHYERMMARPAVRRTIEVEEEMGYELPA